MIANLQWDIKGPKTFRFLFPKVLSLVISSCTLGAATLNKSILLNRKIRGLCK